MKDTRYQQPQRNASRNHEPPPRRKSSASLGEGVSGNAPLAAAGQFDPSTGAGEVDITHVQGPTTPRRPPAGPTPAHGTCPPARTQQLAQRSWPDMYSPTSAHWAASGDRAPQSSLPWSPRLCRPHCLHVTLSPYSAQNRHCLPSSCSGFPSALC